MIFVAFYIELWQYYCQPFNPKNHVMYPKVIPYTKFKHSGIIHFWVVLQTDKQTNRRRDRQTNRWPQTFYPRRSTELAWVTTTNTSKITTTIKVTGCSVVSVAESSKAGSTWEIASIGKVNFVHFRKKIKNLKNISTLISTTSYSHDKRKKIRNWGFL